YSIIDRLTLTKTGPDSLQVNEENTFYAEPNYGSGVTMTWAVNNTACTIHSGDGQYSRNLACGQAANNTTVNLTATANHPQGGSATVTFAIRIGAPVAPPTPNPPTPNPPPTSKSDTTL